MTEPRCEPADPGKDGWHWLGELLDDGEWHPVLAYWFIQRDIGMWHFSGLGRPSTAFEPPALARLGYRYICPVPTPSQIAALVLKARAVLDVMMNAEKPSEALTIGHATDLADALAPFQEIKDA